MNTSTPPKPPSLKSAKNAGGQQDRLKSALRENLKRRKAQVHARTVETPPDDKESQSD